MKSTGLLISLLGVFFMALGILWISCIQIRWDEINPKPVLSKAVTVSVVSSGPEIKKIRSPYAKWYHDFTFWTISYAEVFVAIFYVLTGIFLLKRYVLSVFIAKLTLGADILLKSAVLVFMKFGTIPLSQLTHNRNLLELYFHPSAKWYNIFSTYVIGLKYYLSGGAFYMAALIAYFVFCFYMIGREDLRGALRPAKRNSKEDL